MTTYELEKTRMVYREDWIYTTLAESDDRDKLMKESKNIKISYGKTFEEKLNLNHIDEYGDIVNVEVIKFYEYDDKGNCMLANRFQQDEKGYKLKFYETERELFPEYFKLIVHNQHHVKLIVGKLCRHYKISIPKITFTARKGASYYKEGRGYEARINFPKIINIEMICHEVAHHYNLVKKGNYNHSKKLMSTIRRFINYCRKMNYWGYAQKEKEMKKK